VTPLLESAALNERVGGRVLIKAEDPAAGRGFKFRGAYNRLSQLSVQQRGPGVVAYRRAITPRASPWRRGCWALPALIVMPADAPKVKIEATRAYGAEIRFYDRRTENREAITAEIAANAARWSCRPSTIR